MPSDLIQTVKAALAVLPKCAFTTQRNPAAWDEATDTPAGDVLELLALTGDGGDYIPLPWAEAVAAILNHAAELVARVEAAEDEVERLRGASNALAALLDRIHDWRCYPGHREAEAALKVLAQPAASEQGEAPSDRYGTITVDHYEPAEQGQPE